MSLRINMVKTAAAETCASCGEPITNERVTYQGKVYHHGHQPGSKESKTADLAATGCPASADGLHKWLRYTSDVLPITATCAYCGETAETGTKGGWGGTIGSRKTAVAVGDRVTLLGDANPRSKWKGAWGWIGTVKEIGGSTALVHWEGDGPEPYAETWVESSDLRVTPNAQFGSKKTGAIWTQDKGGLSSNSPVYNLNVGTAGAEVYESPPGGGQWFWNAWLAQGIASDGGPLEMAHQARLEAEAWLAGSGASFAVREGSKKTADADLMIGGGDDWMGLDYAESDHEAVGGLIGNVGQCHECGKGIVRDQDESGAFLDTWSHIQSATASKKASLWELM